MDHLTSNHHLNPNQFSYTKHHSTETTLLSLHIHMSNTISSIPTSPLTPNTILLKPPYYLSTFICLIPSPVNTFSSKYLVYVHQYTWSVYINTSSMCTSIHLVCVHQYTWSVYINTPDLCTPIHLVCVHQYTWSVYTNTPGPCTPIHSVYVHQYIWSVYINTPDLCTPIHLFCIHQYTWSVYTNTLALWILIHLVYVHQHILLTSKNILAT